MIAVCSISVKCQIIGTVIIIRVGLLRIQSVAIYFGMCVRCCGYSKLVDGHVCRDGTSRWNSTSLITVRRQTWSTIQISCWSVWWIAATYSGDVITGRRSYRTVCATAVINRCRARHTSIAGWHWRIYGTGWVSVCAGGDGTVASGYAGYSPSCRGCIRIIAATAGCSATTTGNTSDVVVRIRWKVECVRRRGGYLVHLLSGLSVKQCHCWLMV